MEYKLENPQLQEVYGYKLNYYRKGSGDVVLLVHGITTYSFIWRNIFNLLSKDYDVIAIDLVGCGHSDMNLSVEYSLKQHSIFINEFLNKKNITKIHFVGHDVGGGIAQIFNVNYPEKIITTTLINSVAYDFWPVQPIIAMRTPIIRQLAMASLDFGMFKIIVKKGMYHQEKLTQTIMDYFWAPMKTKNGRKAFLHFAHCLNNRNLLDIENEIHEIKNPVFIIRGEHDVYLSGSIAEKLNKEIPQAVLTKVKTGGHFIQEDEPELLYELIHKFISNA